MKNVEISVPLTFTRDRICSLLTGALEGGSNYWMRTDRERSKRPTEPQVGEDWIDFLQAFPWADGYLGIRDGEGDEDHTLTQGKIEKGLLVMAQKYPRHFADFVSENDDATTSDVFLQCCLFGELVYG